MKKRRAFLQNFLNSDLNASSFQLPFQLLAVSLPCLFTLENLSTKLNSVLVPKKSWSRVPESSCSSCSSCLPPERSAGRVSCLGLDDEATCSRKVERAVVNMKRFVFPQSVHLPVWTLKVVPVGLALWVAFDFSSPLFSFFVVIFFYFFSFQTRQVSI